MKRMNPERTPHRYWHQHWNFNLDLHLHLHSTSTSNGERQKRTSTNTEEQTRQDEREKGEFEPTRISYPFLAIALISTQFCNRSVSFLVSFTLLVSVTLHFPFPFSFFWCVPTMEHWNRSEWKHTKAKEWRRYKTNQTNMRRENQQTDESKLKITENTTTNTNSDANALNGLVRSSIWMQGEANPTIQSNPVHSIPFQTLHSTRSTLVQSISFHF